MPVNSRDRAAYRADEVEGHSKLSDQEKQRMLKTNLPAPSELPLVSRSSPSPRRSRLGVRRFLQNQLHVLVFAVLHGIFSLYIRIRQTVNVVCYQVSSVLYYHHATPQYIRKDVMGLQRRPKHLSAILKAEENHRAKADLERLIDETAELATWCACAEIPMLSVYEKTGILKKHMPRVYEAVIQKFTFYFAGKHPSLSVTSPHKDEYSSPSVDDDSQGHLKLHLISAQDGRESIVDLTRTLAEMSQKGKLSPRDISIELVDAELSEGIMPEPDLLILFSPYVELSSYPPWQIRLTEIFCLKDNERFGYQVFLRALRKYARAQMRHGK
ncbi:diphosphate specific [Purpureocillium takamizusanense]|uniref:ditrans,polycis-polyprenyl diphosphate synthase [(2E,6E)-farnesyldiphosphate specific] n=1 Tax=Purpureocillium takamizusanense TaxID=2060973 RepID=A0A9Q8V6W8_9HYPO|nr:diphosphate specific [Purpureocillium takamizusanense]UNI15123.1 diphosphate specific [Purpureocillium takamizusanense]